MGNQGACSGWCHARGSGEAQGSGPATMGRPSPLAPRAASAGGAAKDRGPSREGSTASAQCLSAITASSSLTAFSIQRKVARSPDINSTFRRKRTWASRIFGRLRMAASHSLWEPARKSGNRSRHFPSSADRLPTSQSRLRLDCARSAAAGYLAQICKTLSCANHKGSTAVISATGHSPR